MSDLQRYQRVAELKRAEVTAFFDTTRNAWRWEISVRDMTPSAISYPTESEAKEAGKECLAYLIDRFQYPPPIFGVTQVVS